MASFSSGGKRPSQPTVIYTPPPIPAPDGTHDDGGAPDTPVVSPDIIQREREQNLLRRARSSLGTVLNGFRGILSSNDSAANQRKSLLGE